MIQILVLILLIALNAKSTGAANVTAAFCTGLLIIPTKQVSARLYSTMTSELQMVGIASFATAFGITAFSDDYHLFLDSVDAVYIASPHLTHYDYAKQALLAGKHVLCEIPFTLKKDEALELYKLAEENNLVLMEASKTAYCPAFGHIVTLIKSGIMN